MSKIMDTLKELADKGNVVISFDMHGPKPMMICFLENDSERLSGPPFSSIKSSDEISAAILERLLGKIYSELKNAE